MWGLAALLASLRARTPSTPHATLLLRRWVLGALENNYFTEMCSGSKAGSCLRLIDFVFHSTLGAPCLPARAHPVYPARNTPASEVAVWNSHGARPVHLGITMIKWTRTSRLSIHNSLSERAPCLPPSILHATLLRRRWGLQGYLAHKKNTPP